MPHTLGEIFAHAQSLDLKTATAELGRARLACSSINTCAAAGPRPDLLQWARDRSQQPALLQTAAETTAGGALLVEQLAKKT